MTNVKPPLASSQDSSDYGTDVELPSDAEDHFFRLIDGVSSFTDDLQDVQGGDGDGELPNFEDVAVLPTVANAITSPPPPSRDAIAYPTLPATLVDADAAASASLVDDHPPETNPEATHTDAASPPIQRFRSKRRSLTVTDLVANLWCEQQFEYTLLRGYKRRTPQMERGTRVHKVLEEQVHTVVPVELSTAEDVWGLKLFNMYQGLLSLRQQGLARELPVFGFWGEVMISGIIDEISYLPPESRVMDSGGVGEGDPEREKKRRKVRRRKWSGGIENALATGKFKVPKGRGAKVAYVCDTKTRSSKSLPPASQAKATGLQLMLYNRLLGELRSGKTDFGMVLELFELDGDARFSDSFIAEIAGLDQSTPLEEILENNSLWGMWSFVQKQVERSIDSMGDSMGVSYRNQDDGGLIGFRTVENEVNVLDDHLKAALAWWKGERSTVGVEIEDAWKCRTCEFEASCSWRLAKIEELRKKRKLFPAKEVNK